MKKLVDDAGEKDDDDDAAGVKDAKEVFAAAARVKTRRSDKKTKLSYGRRRPLQLLLSREFEAACLPRCLLSSFFLFLSHLNSSFFTDYTTYMYCLHNEWLDFFYVRAERNSGKIAGIFCPSHAVTSPHIFLNVISARKKEFRSRLFQTL